MGDGTRHIHYASAALLQPPTHLNVLSNTGRGKPTRSPNRAHTKARGRATDCEETSPHTVGTFNEADDAGVLQRLQLGEKRTGIPHLDIGSGTDDMSLVKNRRYLPSSRGGEHGVCIHDHN